MGCKEALNDWAIDFRSYMDKLPPAQDHLTLGLLNTYGTQSVVCFFAEQTCFRSSLVELTE